MNATAARKVLGTTVTEADAAAHLTIVARDTRTDAYATACAGCDFHAEGLTYSTAWAKAFAHRDENKAV